MAGGSSDSLEQNSSGSCSPHRAEAPLNMDDLEHLAYEQEQSKYIHITYFRISFERETRLTRTLLETSLPFSCQCAKSNL